MTSNRLTSNRLLIGSGSWHWDGWLSIDGDPDNHPDIVAMVPPLPDAVKAMRFTTVLASHLIEHLTRNDALILLKECYAILVEGGTLELELPNLEYCCRVYLGYIDPPAGRSREQFGKQGIFGLPEVDPLMGHKYGYNPDELTELVVEAGFNRDYVVLSAGKYHEPIRDYYLTVMK